MGAWTAAACDIRAGLSVASMVASRVRVAVMTASCWRPGVSIEGAAAQPAWDMNQSCRCLGCGDTVDSKEVSSPSGPRADVTARAAHRLKTCARKLHMRNSI